MLNFVFVNYFIVIGIIKNQLPLPSLDWYSYVGSSGALFCVNMALMTRGISVIWIKQESEKNLSNNQTTHLTDARSNMRSRLLISPSTSVTSQSSHSIFTLTLPRCIATSLSCWSDQMTITSYKSNFFINRHDTKHFNISHKIQN